MHPAPPASSISTTSLVPSLPSTSLPSFSSSYLQARGHRRSPPWPCPPCSTSTSAPYVKGQGSHFAGGTREFSSHWPVHTCAAMVCFAV